ncbi:MAG: hypothetical protein JST44_27615 [Cyanobacteria bacterium SZAS LIN-5]|nr:hypothetical protein [Cyanobacteria bacterium SZAS LIN-5]
MQPFQSIENYECVNGESCAGSSFHELASWLIKLAKHHRISVTQANTFDSFVEELTKQEFVDRFICIELMTISKLHSNLSSETNPDSTKAEELDTRVKALYRALLDNLVIDDSED